MSKRGRGSQLTRLLTILNVLKEVGRAPADLLLRRVWDSLDLAPDDKFDRRTLYRDLKLLSEPPFAWIVHEKRANVYAIAPQARDGLHLSASFEEGMAILLARKLLVPFAGTPAAAGLDSLWEKFRPFFSEEQIELFQDNAARIAVKSSLAGAPDPHVVRLLADATARCYSVRLRYQPIHENKPRSGEYDPYGLIYRDDALYLVAASHRWRAWRAHQPLSGPVPPFAGVVTLKTTRISGVTLLSSPFERPPDLDLDALFANAVGIYRDSEAADHTVEFRLRMGAMAARLAAESPWHRSQTISPTPDGGAVMTLRLAESAAAELAPRVLALGDDAEVLAPASLRRSLADLTAKLLQRYGPPGQDEAAGHPSPSVSPRRKPGSAAKR